MIHINKIVDRISTSNNLTFTISDINTQIEENKWWISLVLNWAKIEVDNLPDNITKDYINKKISEYTLLNQSLKKFIEQLNIEKYKVNGYNSELSWVLDFYKELSKKTISSIIETITQTFLVLGKKSNNSSFKIDNKYLKVYNYTILKRIKEEVVNLKMDIKNKDKSKETSKLLIVLDNCISNLTLVENLYKYILSTDSEYFNFTDY